MSEPVTVSVVVPTLNRHAALARALASLQAQALPEDVRAEIVVVDNSADGNAAAIVRAAAQAGPLPVRALNVTRPGVASARNAGVAAAAGAWIAFLDDDEEAGPGWLAALLSAARATGADAAFGPVAARAETGELGAFARYFSRPVAAATGTDITHLAAYLGTNNSLFSREACRAVPGPFALALDQVGGEDSLFLSTLARDGRRFVWSAQAGIIEWVPPRRLTWDYVRRRRFLSGQIRTFVHAMATPPRRHEVARWMAIGAVQAVLAAGAALAARPFRREAAERFAATAYGGLGKVLWMRRFRPRLYGSGLVS